MVDKILADLTTYFHATYGIQGTVTRLSGGLNNENFLITAANSRYHMKWYETDTPVEKLQREAEALLILEEAKRVSVPAFIPTLTGELRGTFQGRSISCFSFLNGIQKYTLVDAPRSLGTSRSMARTLAILHSDLNNPSPALRFPFLPNKPPKPGNRLKDLLKDCADSLTGALDAAFLKSSLESIDSASENLIFHEQPFIRIHGDFQLSNVFFDGEEIGAVCDFEYSEWEFRAFDCAMALSIILSSSVAAGIDANDHCAAFVESYAAKAEIPWSEIESEALGPLILLSLFLNLSWALSKKSDLDYHGLVDTFLRQTRECCLMWGEKLNTSDFYHHLK